jgi:dihydrofolate reductase
LKAIVAVDKNWGIGKKNGLLFSLKKDMEYFRAKTAGCVVCMGYNTLLSFPNSKPLKNRVNVVLCPPEVERDDCVIVHTLDDLFKELKKYENQEIFVIGGAMFYRTMLDYCQEILVTKVDADGQAEVFFENLDERDNWSCVWESEPVFDNEYTIKFTVYRNASPKALGE